MAGVKNMRRKSLGLSTLGMVALLVGIAFAITLLLKIGPHYLNYRTVQSLVNALTEKEVVEAGRAETMLTLQKRFKVNSLYDMKPEEVIRYKRERGSVSVSIDYEVREHLFGNVYVLLDFEETRKF